MATGKKISLEAAGPGELATFETLVSGLPADWHVVWGRDIPTAVAGQLHRETDFIVVASNVIFICEEKHWQGTFTGNHVHWFRHDGVSRDSPLKQAADLTRKLSGLINRTFPSIAAANVTYNDKRGGQARIPTAIPHVILSHPTCDYDKVDDPRVATDCSPIGTVVERLMAIDAQHSGFDALHPAQLRGQLIAYLDGLAERPERTAIGAYEILEALPTSGAMQQYLARHESGTERVLTVVHLADLPDPADDVRAQVKRSTAALTKLAGTGVVPAVYDYFLEEDRKLLVIPSDPVSDRESVGGLLSEHAPPSSDGFLAAAESAFRSLAAIHELKVLHRNLTPDDVWLPKADSGAPTVLLTGFSYARISGFGTLHDSPSSVTSSPYAAPEVASGLSDASDATDVYALAATMAAFLSATPFASHSDAHAAALENLPKAARDALTSCLSTDPLKRLSSAEVVEALAAARSTRGSDCSAPPTFELHQPPLGTGATATTYRATDLESADSPTRVLKLFTSGHPVEDILREAQTLEALRHDNIVGYAGMGGHGLKQSADPAVCPHLVYQHLDGLTLEEYAQGGATGTDRAERYRDLLLDGLRGLRFMHDKGFIHRDISPRNLFVHQDDSGEERLVVIDLGQARKANHTGVAGTPTYTDPLVEGGGTWTATNDLYSLAATLFVALTGLLPYERDEWGALDKTRLLSPLGIDAPSRVLQERLLRAVQPDSAARYTSAAEFIHALDEPMQIETRPLHPALARSTNPTVKKLRQYYRNSRLGNGANRGLGGDFGVKTYVATRLDEDLRPAVLRGDYALVLFAGNPGDGKTAFLEQLAIFLNSEGCTVEYDDQGGWARNYKGRRYVAVNDASAAVGERSADEYLEAVLEPLAGYQGGPTDFTVLIAANDGRLLSLFTDNPYHQFVGEIVHDELLDEPRDNPNRGVAVVDFKTRALVNPEDPNKSILLRAVRASTSDDLWTTCEGCRAKDQCPIRFNAASLAAVGPETPAARLHERFTTMHLRRRSRLTMRDARSVLSYAITADLSCDEVHTELDRGVNPLQHERLYFWLLSAVPPQPDIGLEQLHDLDPDAHTTPRVDRALNQILSAGWDDLGPSDLNERTGRPPVRTELFRTAMADEVNRRRFAYEGSVAELLDQTQDVGSASDFSPYRHLHDFTRVVTEGPTDEDRDLLLKGLSRIVGVLGFERPGLAVRPPSTDSGDGAVVKLFDEGAFELKVPSRQARVEQVTDQLILRERSGSPLIYLSLDSFELLMRSANGYLPTHPEVSSLLEELRVFARQLMQRDGRSILIIDPAGNSSEAVVGNDMTIQLVQA